jgi:chromosome segregation ATPase
MEFTITPKQDGQGDTIEEEEISEPGLLSADHPLMQRFQQALREHLLKVKGQLESEIQDLDHKIKAKNDSIADAGAKLFDLQNEIEKQRDTLDKYSSQILEISDKRKAHEASAAKYKAEYFSKEENCKELKRKNNEISQEIASMKALESEISRWNAEVSILFKIIKHLKI